LITVEATVHADGGEHAAAREALGRAHTIYDRAAAHFTSAPARNAYTTQFSAATGHVLAQVGDYTGARERLTAALKQPHPPPRRQHVLALIDLATTELHSGDLPAACFHATRAADLLKHEAYAIGTARLRAFRAVAQRPLGKDALRIIDEHLTRTAA
jgi:hypothetical protein